MGWVVNTTLRPLYPWLRTGTHCIGSWVGPRAGLNECRKSRPPPGFHPRTVQPLPSRHTDRAIPAYSPVVQFPYKYLMLSSVLPLCKSADSAVDKVTKLRAQQPRGRSSVFVTGKTYFLPHNARTGSGAHTAFHSISIREIFR
jgi:hypothetical protein